MSAFALRKRLLSQQSAASIEPQPIEAKAPDVVAAAQNPTEAGTGGGRARKLRKGLDAQLVPRRRREEPSDNASSEPSTPTEAPGPSGSSALSSAAEDDALPAAEVPPVRLSSFVPSASNYRAREDGAALLTLSGGERLVILGSYGIRVTSGETTIYGATLRAEDEVHWVDAPLCHALPVLRCADAATLELLPHPSAVSLRALGRLSPQFRRLWNEDADAADGADAVPGATFQILYTSADGPKRGTLQDLISPPEWNREIARLLDASSARPCSVMITGPKSSGKSTFGKILANRLVTGRSGDARHRERRAPGVGVAVLDLDPGQPEYCAAGQIALVLVTAPVLGPSFCHPGAGAAFRVIRSHALASITPASDPELYADAALDLVTHYRNALGHHPLVINTPGWIQGTGLDLLTSLIAKLRPAEVVYMSEYGPAEAVEALRAACKVSSFSMLPSQGSQLTARTAVNLRAMQTMSYFHAEPTGTDPKGSPVRWDARPLTAMPPWQVSYRGADRGIFGILCYDYQVPLDLLAEAINGTVLAAVAVDSPRAFRRPAGPLPVRDRDGEADAMDLDGDGDDIQEPPSQTFSALAETLTVATPEGIPCVDGATALDPRFSQSLGLVLVRGIDTARGVLQLLGPLPPPPLADGDRVVVLVSGKLDPPTWAYTEELYRLAWGEGEEPDEADDDDENNNEGRQDARAEVPWIETLRGNQSRAGAKVWRVRRDLGRGPSNAGG
ncbi:hypothetical protein GGS23DRAFT_604884 [Durotheca rogersii]|uniref:uncharacterized protein n=1 Tax=Durotheca rogersii TaxID=419775 RepID=UPI00221E492C|nr:uncharacterized protein GGS23DRAFT_604884 [Durotheca rogersii]KAI5863957.1 hypothetical protein GGS23DRAFT_604884 [Durotheca rogersii]